MKELYIHIMELDILTKEALFHHVIMEIFDLSLKYIK